MTLLERLHTAYIVLTSPQRGWWVQSCSCGCDRVPCPRCGDDVICLACHPELCPVCIPETTHE